MNAVRLFVPFAASLAVLTACSLNPVHVDRLDPGEGLRLLRRSAIDGELSVASQNRLHDLGLSGLLDQPPAEVARTLGDAEGLDPATALLLAEALLLTAEAGEGDEVSGARVEAVFAAYRVLATATAQRLFDPTAQTAADLYGHAVAQLFADRPLVDVLLRGGKLPGLGREITVVPTPAPDDWPNDFFDSIEPAASFAPEGLRSHHVRLGFGVPLVAVRRQDLPDRPLEPFYPPEARCYPATLLLLPDGPGRLRTRLVDPTTTRTLSMLRGEVPIAADLTMPYAALLGSAKLHTLADRGFFRPEWDPRRCGLFLLEPYRRDKIPVVLIHGLWSSPLVWRDLTNEIWGDDDIAQRFQVWHYLYPTGAPILNNARDLRQAFAAAREHFDPDGDDPAFRDMVLVGHSMGGVIAKTIVQASGDALWNTRFARPLPSFQAELSDEARDYAQRTFFYEPLPFVSRVVFLGAPHRGSDDADSWIGRFGSWLQVRPQAVRDFAAEVQRVAPDAMRQETLATPSSVDVLSPSHVVMQALAELPIAPGVRYHTVAGNIAAEGEEPTDGIVPLRSAHLDGAESELVLQNCDHSVQQDPRTIAEVLRILRTHGR